MPLLLLSKPVGASLAGVVWEASTRAREAVAIKILILAILSD
jgi:hypothetical protein